MGTINDMADFVAPPVAGQVLVLTLDTTSRQYDLRSVQLGTPNPNEPGSSFVRLHAEGADAFFAFSSESGASISETAAESAGASLSGFTTNAAARIPAGEEREFVVDRLAHRYLVVKGSGAGKLRIHASSCPSHG